MKKIYLILLASFFFLTSVRLLGQTIAVTDVPTTLCANESFTLSFTASGFTPSTGNVYSAFLSDQNGSFTNPTIIGTVTSSALTDYIYVTIPANTFQSPTSKYRIRITSSSPVVTGADNGVDIVINCLTRDYYWTGGSGNWSDLTHWQVTTDGVTFIPANEMPTQYDNVNFDDQSFPSGGQLTLDVAADCNDFEWEAGSGASNPVLWSSSNSLNVYGDFELDPGVYRDIRYIYFKTSKYNVTVNLADNLLQKDPNTTWWQGGTLYFATSGSWDLESDVVAENLQNYGGGTVNTADFNITLAFELYNVSGFNAGASTITLSRLSNYATPGNFDAGTSLFQLVIDKYNNMPGINGSQTYNQVNIVSGICNIGSDNTFSNLQVLGGAGISLAGGTTQTITSILTLQGNSRSELAIVESQTPGTQATLYVAGANVDANYVSITDNIIDDGAAGTYQAINAIDGGNNSGWDFSNSPLTPLEYYWVNGTGNWSDLSHWVTSSDGGVTTVPATEGPAPIDNVHFNGNSFPTGGTLTLDKSVAVNNMIWEAGSGAAKPQIYSDWGIELTIFGDLTMDNGVSRQIGKIIFNSSKNTNNITMADNYNAWGQISFEGGGIWNLLDSLYAGSTVYVNDGTLNTNDNPMAFANALYLQGTSPTLNWSNSSVYIMSGLYDYATTPVINAGTATFYFGNEWNSTINVSSNTAALVFNQAVINNTTNFQANTTFNNLTIEPGVTLILTSGTTQTITGSFTAVGTRSEPVTINTDAAGSQATLLVSGATVTADFVQIQDNIIDNGLAADVPATNAINNGNNMGWAFSPITPLDYQWIGGPGKWSDLSHWETSPVGAGTYSAASDLPGPLDDVYFTTNSFPNGGELQIDVNASCHNLTWESGSGSNFPVMTDVYPGVLNVYGSFILDKGVYRNLSTINFEAQTTGNIIDMADNLLANQYGYIYFNGSGDWSLQDSLAIYSITFNNGSFSTNNNPLSVGYRFYIRNSFNGTISLGSSDLYIGSFYNNSSAVTFDQGTSSLYLISPYISQCDLQSNYPNVAFNDVIIEKNTSIYSSFTYNNITIKQGSTVRLAPGETQTITNTFTAIGSRSQMIGIESLTSGSPATIFIDLNATGSIDVKYLILQDNTLNNGLATDQVASFSIDNGGNTGWDFAIDPLTSLDYYWIGGTGNWSDISHWATDANGTTLHTDLPGVFDNVNFTGNSFPSGGTITLDIPASCNDMVWTDGTFNPTIKGEGNNSLTVSGNFIMADGVNRNIEYIIFDSDTTNQIAMRDNRFEYSRLEFRGGGTWNLIDSLAAYDIYIYSGTLNTNNNSLYANYFSLSGNDAITVNLGSSNLWLNSLRNYATNSTFDPGSSTIYFSNGQLAGNITVNNIVFNGNANSNADLTVNGDLTIQPGVSLLLDPNYTTTINGNLIANGTRPQPVIIESTIPGTQATISKASGTVSANYIILQDNLATGGATFNATNAIDNGNVSGWNITAVTPTSYYWNTASGDWSDVNSWSLSPTTTTVPGAAPGPVDNVFITSTSPIASGGTMNLDIKAACTNMTWEAGITGATVTGNDYRALTIQGSLTVSSSVNFDISQIGFVSDATGNNIDLSGNTNQDLNLDFDGNGEWNLTGDLDISGLSLFGGVLNSGNFQIQVDNIYIQSPGIVNLGSSDVFISRLEGSGGAALAAGTSTIYFTDGTIYSSWTFNDVDFDGRVEVRDNNTYNTLTLQPGAEVILQSNSTQTVNQLVAVGKRSSPIIIKSTDEGVQANFLQSSNAVAGEYLFLQDNNALGGAAFSAQKSIDNGNVTGWTITSVTPRQYYWVGGSGNWSDAANHWATADGGTNFFNESPGPLDNAFFTASSFSGNSTLTLDQPAWVDNMDWTGNTAAVSISDNNDKDNTLTIGGSLTLSNGVSRDFYKLIFLSTKAGNTINLADNLHSNNRVEFRGNGGEWTLAGDFVAKTTSLYNGTFNSNDFKFTSEYLFLNSNSISNWGNSVVDIRYFVNSLGSNGAFNAENSTFQFTDPNNRGNFLGGSSRFYIADFYGYTLIDDANIFFNATVNTNGTLEIQQNQSFNTLNVNEGATITIRGNSTQTISDALNLNGSIANPIIIKSSDEGTAGIFSAPTAANITADFVHLQDNTATGGANFTATNSADFGNVTGWNGLLTGQTIDFAPLNDQLLANGSFTVSATASSSLPVSFEIASGDATVSGNTITPNSSGLVGIRAIQNGDATYGSAKPIVRYVHIDATSDPTELGNMKEAKLILGQTDATSNDEIYTDVTLPRPLSSTVLPYLADGSTFKQTLAVANGTRVMLWFKMPTDANTPADLVLGQPDFTNDINSGPSPTTFHNIPYSVAVGDGYLFVGDGSRVMAWLLSPSMQNGAAASFVIGQPDLNTVKSGTSSTQFASNMAVFVSTFVEGATTKLLVSDMGNNRVLIYNQIPSANGAAADVVIGQPDFTSAGSGSDANQLFWPVGTAVSPDGKLLIADYANHRVLIYNTIPTTNGAAADVVLGQIDFGYSDSGVGPTSLNMPIDVSVSRTGKLAICDNGNNRILIYNSIPTDNTTAPDIILGQPDANSNTPNYNSISGRTLNAPFGVEWDVSGNLLVSDQFNNRLLVYGAADLEAPQASNLSVPTTIISGSSNTASVTLSDRSGILEASLNYRGLSSSSPDYLISPMTGDPATGIYTVDVALPNNEQLGLDYFIVLKDGLLNIDTIAFTLANIRYPNGLPVNNFGVGNQQNQYRITAIPLDLDNKDAVTVFDEITAGTYDNKKIRLFSWPGGPSANTSYAEYGSGFTNMTLGSGYFTLAASSASVLSGAGETPKVGQTGPITIDLIPGWNLIGNPYNFSVSWSDIQTASGITDAEAQVPQGFNGSFFDANTLGAGEGAFVFNPTSNNVTLTIPITNNAGGRISEAPENTNPLSADSWEIRLLRTDQEGYEMQLAAVGMATDALYSYDKYDRVQPPAIAETPRMVVSHPEFFEPAFQKDIRTTKNYEKWEFTYTGPANSGKEEVIYWDNSYFGADAPPVYLLDKTRFKVVDMRQQDTYSFVNGGTTEFEIHFGEGALEALLPEDVLFTTPYPNPFSSAVNFNIGLPSAAKEYQVQVDIYNTMGQQITSLQASNIVGGYYNFSWNGLDEKGQAVPDGVYIYRMTIAGENSRVVSGKIIKH